MSMVCTVSTKSYAPPAWDRREILRYAGVRGDAPMLDTLLDDCLREIDGKLIYRLCCCELPIVHRATSLDLGFAETDSASLRKHLAGCDRIVLFAATVGLAVDRLIARYAAVSPTRSLLFQAIGAERIEALCETFSREVTEKQAAIGFSTRARFSPGYGDLPLSLQRDIFAALDCPRKIGLTLNESLLMSPSKSVTAIIGVSQS